MDASTVSYHVHPTITNDTLPSNMTVDLFASDTMDWTKILTITVFAAIIVITLIGNLMVIASVFIHAPLRIVQNFFIVSLAFADITVAVFVLPLSVAYWTKGRWTYGRRVCQMWLTMDILCCTSSILHLCAIALDRYRAITSPITHAQKRNVCRVTTTIALVWTTSMLISFPPLLGWNDWPLHFSDNTPCELTEQRLFVVYSSCGSFFIPLVVMGVLYAKIFSANRRRFRERTRKLNGFAFGSSQETHRGDNADSTKNKTGKLEKTQTQSTLRLSMIMDESKADCLEMKEDERKATVLVTLNRTKKCIPPRHTSSSISVHKFVEEKQRIYLSKERKASRTLGIIMGVFVVCWLPFFMMYVILPFCTSCGVPDERIKVFITWLGYLNSSLNPIIYTIFNRDFRKAFTIIVTCDFHNLRRHL